MDKATGSSIFLLSYTGEARGNWWDYQSLLVHEKEWLLLTTYTQTKSLHVHTDAFCNTQGLDK